MAEDKREAVEIAMRKAATDAKPVVDRLINDIGPTLPLRTVGLHELKQLAFALSAYLKLEKER